MNESGNGLLIALLIIIGAVTILGLFTAGTYNSLVNKDTNVEQKWANVQTAYERRADLIPNLVATVKGYSDYEGDVQKTIAQYRSGIQNAKNPTDLDKVGNQMNGLISNLIVSVEAYPDLKASQNYLSLQDELAGTENRIKAERDKYNEAIKEYKISVRTFPNNIFASMFNFDVDKWDMFKAQEGSENAPEVDFTK